MIDFLITTSEKVTNLSYPKFCLIGYANDKDEFSDLKYYPIKNNEFQAEIPFTNDCLKELKKASEVIETIEKKELNFKGLIPKNVIFFKNKDLIWTIEPSQKYLYFSKHFVLNDNYYHLPKLLFAYIDSKLHIYAIKSNDEINDKIILYNAPFLNVNSEGSVCMGNTNIKIDKFFFVENAIQYLENAFFKSIFTHTNHNRIINGNIVEYYQQQQNHFDENILLKSRFTIKTLLKFT